MVPPAPQPPGRKQLFFWLGWMWLANVLLLTFIAGGYLRYGNLPSNWEERFFLLLAFPGQMMFLAMIPALPVAAWIGAAPLLRKALRLSPGWGGEGVLPPRLLALAGFTFLAGLVAVDTQVFQLFRFHINSVVWHLLTGGAAGDIFRFSWLEWGEALGLAALVAGGQWLAGGRVWHRVTSRTDSGPGGSTGVSPRRLGLSGGGWVGLLAVLVVASGQLWYAWADANRYTPVTRAIHLMPWPQPLRMGDFFESVGWVSPQEQIRLPSFSDGDRYPLKPLDCKPGASPPNILLIVLDAWRHDMLGPGTTPNLWEYSRKSWVFSHHYAAANETRYGVFGMFYGLVGSYWTTMLGQSRGPVLMDELVNQGYRMGVYGSAALTSPEFDRTVFVRVRDSIPLSTPGADMAQKDMEITRRFLAFLDQPSPKPFFGFLFYDAPHAYEYPDQAHAPFQPVWNSINYSELNPDFDPLPFVNRYKNAVHFADSEAAKVLQALARKGLDKTTVVVITADHGQEFNDTGHNYWGHGGNFSDAQVRVPLVIHWPGEPPRVFTHMTSQLDLAPTLLTRALGCKTDPALYSNGRLLLRQDPRPFMMVSSGTRFGLVEADRITVVEDFGEIQVVDKNLNPMKAEPDGAKLKQVLDEMRKF